MTENAFRGYRFSFPQGKDLEEQDILRPFDSAVHEVMWCFIRFSLQH